MHLFLSPHPDDIPLSCGAFVHHLSRLGESVLVVTTMAGDPVSPVPDTPIVRELHERWKIDGLQSQVRRVEDAHAVQTLGAQVIHLDIPDCVYRTHEGTALYPDGESIFGEVHPQDPAYMALDLALAELLVHASHVYVPMAVGHHVDHQLVREWALGAYEEMSHVAWSFYEDYPYSENTEALQKTLDSLLESLPIPVEPDLHLLHDENVEAKLNAVASYQSQISTFWSDIQQMYEAVRTFMKKTGQGQPAERFWHITTQREKGE